MLGSEVRFSMNDIRKTAPNPLPRQWSLTAVTLLILGIALGQYIPAASIIGGGMLIIGLIVCFGWRLHHLFLQCGLGVAFLGMAIIHGGSAEDDILAAEMITARQQVEATGVVATAEAMTKGRQRIRFTPDSSLTVGETTPVDWRLILPRRMPQFHPGDRISISARIEPPLPQLLPGGFDFAAHAAKKGYAATGFVSDARMIGRQRPDIVAAMRSGIQSRLVARLGEKEAAVASAVLIGFRGLIAPDLREKFRASGLAHLLAISGLHMALFCGGVIFVLRAMLALMPGFASRHAALKIAVLVALPFGAGYLLLAGMPISAIRAYGMMVLFILAILIDRRGLTLHHVALMAILLLLLDPGALNDPAFQMSFAAVFALVAGWYLLQGWRISRGYFPSRAPLMRLARHIGGIMMASILASAASIPFVLYHFGVTTAWSVLANIIGMPLMAFIVMPAGVLALLLMPLGLEAVALIPMEFGLRLLIGLADMIEGLPLSALRVPPPSAEVLLLLVMAALVPFTLMKWWRLASPALVMVAIIIWQMTATPHAAIIALHGRMHALVIDDSGSAIMSSSGNRFAEAILRRPFGVNAALLIDTSEHECRRGYCLIATADGRYAAYVFRRYALTDACRNADLVIAWVEALYPCHSGALLIDRKTLSTRGGSLVYYREGRLDAVFVNTSE